MLHPPPLLLLLLRGGVTLEAIMAQLECMDARLDTLITELAQLERMDDRFSMTCLLSFMTKRGSSFGLRVVMYLGRELA